MDLYESLFPQEDELTLYGFLSHMETYIKQLLDDPIHAQPDEYLKSHGLDGAKALAMLLKRTDRMNPDSAVLKRKERIAPEDLDENGAESTEKPKDLFHIRYSLPRKDYHKKMRNLYINAFESHIVKGCPINEEFDMKNINEEGEGGCACGCSGGDSMCGVAGATTAQNCNDSAVIQPLGKKVIKRKNFHITESQLEYIKKRMNEEAVMNTKAGNFGYDAPIGGDEDFYKEANDHKDMMKKSWKKNVKK